MERTNGPVPDPIAERKVDLMISNILRGGVILSSVIVAIGTAGLLAQYWNRPFVQNMYDKELRSIPSILRLVADGKPEAIIELGVLVLLSTPLLRVAFAGLAFLKQKDYVYVAIALLVLSGLGYSLLFSDG